MYAVIETGGKQYKVAPGEILDVEKLDVEVGTEIGFDRVLLVGKDNETMIGTPTLENARVTAEIMEHGKARKVIVFKKKRRKGYKVKRGHRQPYTRVAIKAIEVH